MTNQRILLSIPIDGAGAKFAQGDDGCSELSFRAALIEAAMCVNEARRSFDTASGIDVGEWPGHPDLAVVKRWLEARDDVAHDLEVIYWLAVHVRSAWQELPKRTLTAHRKLYSRIEELCQELRTALDETGSPYYRGGGHGLQWASVADLLTDQEAQGLDAAMSTEDGERNDPRRMLPQFEELLDRMAQAAARLGEAGPLHTQPGKRGAERGYFVRQMARFMQSRYGQCPHEVLAAIASVALGEPTDRELVAKLLA